MVQFDRWLRSGDWLEEIVGERKRNRKRRKVKKEKEERQTTSSDGSNIFMVGASGWISGFGDWLE